MQNTRIVMIGFWMIVGLLLMACSSAVEDEVDSSEHVESTRPTLNVPALDAESGLTTASPTPQVLPIAMDDPRFPIQPATGAEFEAGQVLYEQSCGNCHGMDGEGQMPNPLARGMAPPHDDTGHTWHHPDQQNFATVWQGRDIVGNMPGFSDSLTPDEVVLILAYIKTWWSDEYLAAQLERTEAVANGG